LLQGREHVCYSYPDKLLEDGIQRVTVRVQLGNTDQPSR